MTNDTFKTFKFILRNDLAFGLDGFMAGLAGNFSMPPFEFKGSIVVIEIADAPLFESMAAGAVGGAVPFELPAVR